MAGRLNVQVRAGLHAGRPTLTDTGYVGLAVHAANRVCSAGSGGQIVLSRAALRAMADELPPGVSVVDLGAHRLRGIPDTEQLYAARRGRWRWRLTRHCS